MTCSKIIEKVSIYLGNISLRKLVTKKMAKSGHPVTMCLLHETSWRFQNLPKKSQFSFLIQFVWDPFWVTFVEKKEGGDRRRRSSKSFNFFRWTMQSVTRENNRCLHPWLKIYNKYTGRQLYEKSLYPSSWFTCKDHLFRRTRHFL